ncbi:MAG: hypothetical protein HY513_01405 [Candidatus Aenigmarchaeota archaeon]|nr:hypothetical protein [Candidatus Aenigmarchaeota archaeon]
MTTATSDMLVEELKDGAWVYSKGLTEPPKIYDGILSVTRRIMFLDDAEIPTKEVLIQIAHSPVSERWTEDGKRFTRYPTFDPLNGAITNYRVISQAFRSHRYSPEGTEENSLRRSRLVDVQSNPYGDGIYSSPLCSNFFGSGRMAVDDFGTDSKEAPYQAKKRQKAVLELKAGTTAISIADCAYILLGSNLHFAPETEELSCFSGCFKSALEKLLPEKLNGMTIHDGRISGTTNF